MKQTLVSAVLLAVVVAVAVAAAVWRARPVPRENLHITQAAAPDAQERSYPLVYEAGGTVRGDAFFKRDLVGIAIDRRKNLLYAAADGAIKVFDHCDSFLREFAVSRPPLCVGLDEEGNVLVGQAGQVEKYSPEGKLLATIVAGSAGRASSVAGLDGEVLVGDSDERRIVRYSLAGRRLGVVPASDLALVPAEGERAALPRIVLANKMLDFTLAPGGGLVVAHPGMHAVDTYDLNGKMLSTFGSYSETDPAGFPGCCNPINVAAFDLACLHRADLSGPAVVTAEKAVARVKIHDAYGKLLGLIGPSHFDQENTTMDLAADAGGRIFVVDTNRRVIRRFAPAAR